MRQRLKNKESYDQLTLTRQNTGGKIGRTPADEKCVECQIQSGGSSMEVIGKTKKATKKKTSTLFSTFNHCELSGIVTGAKMFVYI